MIPTGAEFRGTSCDPWRRQWHLTPALLPGKSHGRRSLVGCSPWGREESDTTERLPFHFSLSCIGEGNGNPLQYSCLENPRDGGAWWAAIYGVTQSRTQLKQLSSLAAYDPSLKQLMKDGEGRSRSYRHGDNVQKAMNSPQATLSWRPPHAWINFVLFFCLLLSVVAESCWFWLWNVYRRCF